LAAIATHIHNAQQFPSVIAGVAAIRFVSSHHFPRHTHDQFGIGMIDAGGHRSWSGIGTVRALAGDVIMCNPGEVHDGAPIDGGVRRWRIVYFDPAIVRAEVVRPVAHDPLLADRVNQLFQSLTQPQADRFECEENLLRSVICLLHRHSAAKLRSPRSTPLVARAVERIRSAPDRQVTLAELAALTGVSRFQLLRGFARELGITPHAYLIQQRVLLAQRLLAIGHTVANAAVESGFADQSHLTRAFVRQTGVTPARYRAAISFKTRTARSCDA